MTGPAVAAVIGEVLAEWRSTGYWPPPVCGTPHPWVPEFRCTLEPHDSDVLHGWTAPAPRRIPPC